MWHSLSFQSSSSPLMSQLVYFHDHAYLVVFFTASMVFLWGLSLVFNKKIFLNYTDFQQLEVIWTFFPVVILSSLAFPSLRLLYLMDEAFASDLTLKVIGSQWFWKYEYSDFPNIQFESYMIASSDLTLKESGLPRLLEVDGRVTLPVDAKIRLLLTSSDVIHAWTIPSAGVKMDAIPGRLNQTFMILNRPGNFYGQCSEICGANHSFMPIVVEAVSSNHFASFINLYKNL